jgi:hypothetical protein
MAYKFSDRLKEWTTYVGVAAVCLGAVLPHFMPPGPWVQVFQTAQMALGAMLMFVPQTAGSTAVENDSWALLKAFTAGLPPEYAAGVQPLLSTLAGHLARIEAGAPPPIGINPMANTTSQVVMATPVAQPLAQPVMVQPVVQAMPFIDPTGMNLPQVVGQTMLAPGPITPLIADPAKSLRPFGT